MREATSERTGLTTKAVKQQSLSEATATAYARAAPLWRRENLRFSQLWTLPQPFLPVCSDCSQEFLVMAVFIHNHLAANMAKLLRVIF